ncbi:hypothetical protein L1077_08730 [Pseudoalteromonas luteoviolacea]|uniref:hypothetical protein n=1 Tax=Pseudoalteromonas luteoviolacea TaxID=43657 RepID=UPI001F32F8A2|nr:hypothetical protein [Pseudoalteromonas luteoviolacea]MCF6439510.1 hypothetical protein [Pseudoalteromonas luteoviolacea]
MKINAGVGALINARNTAIDKTLQNTSQSSEKITEQDPQIILKNSSLINSEAEALRGKSDNGKLVTLTYTRSGRLDLPKRYEEHRELIERVANSTSKLYLHDTPAAADRMAEQYESILASLREEIPQLDHLSWGFSIDTSGKLITTGHLNQTQKEIIEEALNSNEKLVNAAQDFKSHFLEGLQIERGSVGTSQYREKYDVNEENFADIIDFKEMFEQSWSSEEHREAYGYLINKWEWTGNITDQLRARAEPKFAK